jgi:protocatechuate 3,4-dioxygenase, beta subunit
MNLGENSMSDIVGYRKTKEGTQPNYLHPAYVSTLKRAPSQPLIMLPHTLSEITGPTFSYNDVSRNSFDLTRQHRAEPLGERIIVSGRIVDEDNRPIQNSLVEMWQANASGRYLHKKDQHDVPLDPNFTGCGQTITDENGNYRFITIRPGAYPWGNHHNAWRPPHLHFSLFGPAFATRLVTQMYFPGDPLLAFDPIFNCTADEEARKRLICIFDWETTVSGYALGYRFDMVLRGRNATPMEN